MKTLISVSAVLALVVTTAMPMPVAALDLGKSVDRVSRGLSRTVDKVSGGRTGGRDEESTPGSSAGGASTAGPSGTTSGTSGSGAASVSASVGKNGVKAKIGSGLLGGTQVTVGALNPSGAAEVGARVGNARAGAAVLSKRQLATLRIDANPPSTGNVSLPGAGSGGGGVVGVTPDYARKLLASLNRSEEQILMQRCAMILRSPKAFDAELVLLCRLVAQL